MSYANATVDPAQRARAVLSVIGVHVLVGAGLVAGLAVTVGPTIKDDNPIAIDFNEDPPPAPEPVEQMPDDVVVYTPPAAPIPDIPIERDSPITVVTPDDTISPITNTIPVEPPISVPTPAQPTLPAFTPQPPTPANAMVRWITTADYSNSDLRRGREGLARYRLVVGTDGRVDACEITASTSHNSLDTATCRLITQRARFNPATNSRGEDVVGTFSGSVTWRIPE